MSTAAAAATSQLQSSLQELHIGEKSSTTPDVSRPNLTTSSLGKKIPKKKRVPIVADSWEDEVDSTSDTEAELSPNVADARSLSMSPATAEGPLDPPPTPTIQQQSQSWTNNIPGYTSAGSGPGPSTSKDQLRRPEKQTAVAGRLIAGALGIRAPKRTEEERKYDRAMKEQEIKRRNKEKEEAARVKEEEERAKAAVWDD